MSVCHRVCIRLSPAVWPLQHDLAALIDRRFRFERQVLFCICQGLMTMRTHTHKSLPPSSAEKNIVTLISPGCSLQALIICRLSFSQKVNRVNGKAACRQNTLSFRCWSCTEQSWAGVCKRKVASDTLQQTEVFMMFPQRKNSNDIHTLTYTLLGARLPLLSKPKGTFYYGTYAFYEDHHVG